MKYKSISLHLLAISCLLAAIFTACSSLEKQMPAVSVSTFGKLPDGQPVSLFTITVPGGITMKAVNYGGIITSLLVPGRDGKPGDIVLGYDSLDGYLASSPYFGALVGRYANRIAKGTFTLDSVTYRLACNNGPNHLHGGNRGFDKVFYDAKPFTSDTSAGVIFHYLSRDGEEGYPGNLDLTVAYTLTNQHELIIDYLASTDKATPVNLSQHTYWNLAGQGDILSHELMIRASAFTPVDTTLIPTGESRPVEGTPWDFRKPKQIGRDLMLTGGSPVGYDHNFVLDAPGTGEPAVRLSEKSSGRWMEIYTDQPGVQFYTGNFLDGSIQGKNGIVYRKYSGIVLETQHFPDSPNRPEFPTTILRPGEKYQSQTVYKFGAGN
jgi:aldose 1-epimerase